MNLRSCAAALSLCLSSAALAADATDWPPEVKKVVSEKGKTVTVEGKMEDGKPIDDLSWAANSSMACWPATQNVNYRGNHVLYATSLPGRSIMRLKVTPKDPASNLSIWAYTVGTNNFRTPPTIQKCVSCEAEQKWDRPKKGQTQDSSRSIRLNAVGNPYNVLIGVTGPKEAAGEFTLEIAIE